jgi:hypothetical protein
MKASDLSVQIVEEADDDGGITTYLALTNLSSHPIGKRFRLYFSLGLEPTATESSIQRVLVEGRYGYLQPNNAWLDIEPSETRRIQVENWLFSGMEFVARQGFHLAQLTAETETLLGAPQLLPPLLQPLVEPRNLSATQLSPNSEPRPSPRVLVDTMHRKITIPHIQGYPGNEDRVQPITFESLNFQTNEVTNDFSNEFWHLETLLDTQGVRRGPGGTITLLAAEIRPSCYQLIINEDGIEVAGGDATGVFYGIQTLRQLMTVTQGRVSLPKLTIEDAPDFSHRAFFLDISRHYQPPAQIKKLIRAMASYKMNKLQLGLSNDEGWRLEIKNLPELTDIGSRRQYSPFDAAGNQTALYPAWGDDHEENSGYLKTNEFIELLAYAKKHHVDIVPEINLPGHANALISSLDSSMNSSGRFTLIDPDDESEHRSAQGYTHNVVNPALPDTYKVARVIIEDIKALYVSANAPLTGVHFGGDEVPHGAWLKSPACRQLPLWQNDWNTDNPDDANAATSALMTLHYEQLKAIADELIPDAQTGFWHEMSAYGTSSSYYNAWATASGQHEIVADLLDRNHHLVVSNASYLYLDMPYRMAPDEIGLPWAGYVNTRMIYQFDPLGCWNIPQNKSHLVDGLQAQLWSETITTDELMDRQIFPRLLAVAERCWNRQPDASQWPGFAIALSDRELPYLTSLGIRFHPFLGY